MVTPGLTNDDDLLRAPHSDSRQPFPGQLLMAATNIDEDCKPARLRSREDGGVSGAGSSHPGWLQLGLGVGGFRSSFAAFSDLQDPSVSESRDFFSRPVVGVYGHRGPPEDDARRAYMMTATPSSVARMPQSVGRPPAILSDSGWVRVVGRPRRPQTGLWLALQAAWPEQQVMKQLFLSQISRSYLRIKDGRMTVRLLMKYLGNKLGLENGSHVEITCRGQQLPPFLTLTTVRDNIWSSPDAVDSQCYSDSSFSSSAKYVMNLLYRRSKKQTTDGR